ncbi:MAG: LysR family transcriptional regulator [Sphingobium sp.]
MSGLSVHMLIRKVDLLSLRLFLGAIEERQIGRAATRENIAASAATKRILDLEDVVGIRLLDRNSRGVTPTPAGEVLAEKVRHIFSTLEEMRRELGDFAEGVRGHVRVASTGAILIQYFAQELGEFVRNFPFIDVEIIDDVNPAVVQAVRSGQADLGIFVADPAIDCEGLDCVPYRSDRLVVVHPLDHAFAQKASVTLADVMQERFIGITPTTTIMSRIRDEARASGRELEPKYSVNSVEAARSLVQAGLGVSIQPEWMLSIEDFERVGTVSIDEPWAKRNFFIGRLANKPLSAAAQLLIDQISGPLNKTDEEQAEPLA